jgi:hypothetical protein
MTLFRALTVTAVFIIIFIVSFIVARGFALEQSREGLDKIGSVSTMPVPTIRGAIE